LRFQSSNWNKIFEKFLDILISFFSFQKIAGGILFKRKEGEEEKNKKKSNDLT